MRTVRERIFTKRRLRIVFSQLSQAQGVGDDGNELSAMAAAAYIGVEGCEEGVEGSRAASGIPTEL